MQFSISYLWASDPAGGVGCLKSLMAGVELLNKPDPLGVKFPPRKCRICALVGFCGVGASGSTAAITKGPWHFDSLKVKVGGPAVAG